MTRRGAALVVVAVVLALVLMACRDDSNDVASAAKRAATTNALSTSTTTAAPTTTTTLPPAPAADTTKLTRVNRITGDISPKSVVASGHGIVFAENMMYTHTVTAYNADGSLAATIPDSVDLSAFGVTGHPGISKGAPVETAFTRDGR